MRLHEFGPDDVASIETFVEIENALHVDAPWLHPATVYRRQMMVRHGWDGEPGRHFLAHDGNRRTQNGQQVTPRGFHDTCFG